METKNSFLSFIALGSFNPAILTPDFLAEEKIFSFETSAEGRTSPVVSEIKFGDISLLVELERFQVMHQEVDSFEKSPIISIMSNYLNVLKHTPVFVEGINFNIDLTDYADSTIVANIFEKPINGIINYVDKSDEYFIDINTKVARGKDETQAINCKFYVDDGVSVSINLRKLDVKMVLNFNYEVQNIESDRNRLNIIPDNYQSIYEEFIGFVEKIKK